MSPTNAAALEPVTREQGVIRFHWDGREVVRPILIDAEQAAVFSTWLDIVRSTGVRYALGGAYALYAFTGIWRDTKDIDIFVEPKDVKPLLVALRAAGFETEVRDQLWLAKAHSRPYLMDLLFAVRHATRLEVSDEWFQTCHPAHFLGVPTCLLAPEEVIASKVYVAARDRFDGADIVHLIRAVEGRIDWQRVIDLLGGDEEIVLWHLLLFQFVYPGHVGYLPTELMQRAFRRLEDEWKTPPHRRTFRGTLLDSVSFAVDREDMGYEDTRDRAPLIDAEGTPV